MALTATQTVEALVRAGTLFQQFEGRFSSYGAFKAFRDMAGLLLPEEEVTRIKSQQNAVPMYFPVINKATVPVITARSCNITGNDPTSAKVSITSIVRGFEFTVIPKVSDNNQVSETEQYATGLYNGLRSVMPGLDTYAANLLEANKSTVLAAPTGLAGVAVVANAYQVDNAQRGQLYYKIPSIMALNDINGVILNIANTTSRELMLEYEAKGTYNEENKRAVLEGDLPSASNLRHYTSNRIVPGAGILETHYLVANGSIGVFVWNDSDSVNQRNDNLHKRYTQKDPVFGIRWDVRETTDCVDLSATLGAEFTAVVVTKYQFAANFGFLNAYSSDGSKPIYKLELKAAA